MKFSKKAMAMGMVVSLILALVAFVLIARLVHEYNKKGERNQAIALCKDSVALRAATGVALGGEKSVELKTVPPLCKTIDEKIRGDKEKIQRLIAEDMVTCWQMFGEGTFKSNIFSGINLFGTDAKCFMCFTILIDESSDFKASDEGISQMEFDDFLLTKDLLKKKQKYLDYFQSGGGPGYVMRFLSETEGIKPGRAYAVMYKAKSEDCGATCPAAVIGGAAATLFGIGTKSISTTVQGAALLGVGISKMIDDFFKVKANIDSVMLVDLSRKDPSDRELSNAFLKHCSLVTDVAGGGGN